MQTFPQPLTAEEEQEAFSAYKAGDINARNKLIEHNLRLVAHIVKKYQNSDEEMEDLLSIGTIGLMKAITTFDAEKGRLATYAARCIENELLMLFRSHKKLSKEVSLYEPIGKDKEGNEVELIDVMESNDDNVFDLIERRQLYEVLKKHIDLRLTDREKEIIVMRYGLNGQEEMTQREIGKALNISRSYVSRIEKKALKKLKDSFDEGE